VTTSPFLDREHPPTEREVHAALGEAATELWDEIVQVLEHDLGARRRYRWDGRRSGWSVPFTRAGRPFVTLTPEHGAIAALVVLGRAEADAAAGLPLGQQVRDLFASSSQLHDGRWLFLTIASREDMEDLVRLLTVKLPPRIRARLALARPPLLA
jgi:hypothetical protein